jgi:hypothetical protein
MLKPLHVTVERCAHTLDVAGNRVVFAQQNMEVDMIVGKRIVQILQCSGNADVGWGGQELGVGQGWGCSAAEDELLSAEELTDLDCFAGSWLSQEEGVDTLGQVVTVWGDPF